MGNTLSSYSWKRVGQMLFLCCCLLTCTARCHKTKEKGILYISAPESSVYEIYKIKESKNYQLIAETIGYFNQNISLEPGSYLVLADCSHRSITIYPKETLRLQAHMIQFVNPDVPSSEGLFSIQCNRETETRSRQHLLQRFQLFVLPEKVSMLVNMVPFSLDFSLVSDKKSSRTSYVDLAALRVVNNSPVRSKSRERYFISTTSGRHSITQPQDLGLWQFLLPGTYELSLNGSQQRVSLSKGEKKSVETSIFEFTTPGGMSLKQFEDVSGTPFQLLLEPEHVLDFNHMHTVLPGRLSFRLHSSQKSFTYNAKPNQIKKINTRVVTVKNNCMAEDWLCLGKKEVLLFDNPKSPPYMVSVSDVPILYLHPTAYISTYSARGIYYKLPLQDVTELSLGELQVSPVPLYKKELITDLVRVEGAEKAIFGYSQDVSSSRRSSFFLVAGDYKMVSYVSSTDPLVERKKEIKHIRVRPYKTSKIEAPFYLPERQFKKLRRAYLERVQKKDL